MAGASPSPLSPASPSAPAPARRGEASAKGALARVAVPLDTSDRETFRAWCRLFGPRVGWLKVGLEAFVRWGPAAVEEAARQAPVFLDLKLHDIPNTVAAAVAAARDLGAGLLTVHAGGGPEMLAAARHAAGDRGAGGGAAGELGLLAVTLLTHLDAPALEALDLGGPGDERVTRWAALARQAGCAGVVCSAREAAALRAEQPRPFLLVTPGIRPAGAGHDDQRRVATPAEALAGGADLLVIGRPLTRAADPGRALDALERELSAAGR